MLIRSLFSFAVLAWCRALGTDIVYGAWARHQSSSVLVGEAQKIEGVTKEPPAPSPYAPPPSPGAPPSPPPPPPPPPYFPAQYFVHDGCNGQNGVTSIPPPCVDDDKTGMTTAELEDVDMVANANFPDPFTALGNRFAIRCCIDGVDANGNPTTDCKSRRTRTTAEVNAGLSATNGALCYNGEQNNDNADNLERQP